MSMLTPNSSSLSINEITPVFLISGQFSLKVIPRTKIFEFFILKFLSGI